MTNEENARAQNAPFLDANARADAAEQNMKSSARAWQEQVRVAESEAASLRAEAAEWKAERRIFCNSAHRDSIKLTAANARIAELERRNGQLIQREQLDQDKIDAAIARADAAERDLRQQESERVDAIGGMANAESEAASLRAEVERIRSVIARAEAAERAAERKYDEVATSTRHGERLDEMEARAEAAEAQTVAYKDDVLKLRNLNSGLLARIAELESDVLHLSNGVEKANARAEAAEQNASVAALEISRCHRLWQEDKAALLRMNAAAERWERRNGELDLARERAESEAASLRAEVDRLRLIEELISKTTEEWVQLRESARTGATVPAPSIQSMVRADLEERERLGIERYGTALYPHNGRNALQDAYEEAIDLVFYMRQAIEEQKAKP